jgi:2-methylcitrate dehydratase PrpD
MVTTRLNRRELLQRAVATALCGQRLMAQGTPTGMTLARILSKINFRELPPIAIKHAKMILASTLASAASGTQIESARIVRELAKEQGGQRESSVWFDATKLPATEAARVNAMLSDAAASDDSDLRNVAHIGTCLTATGLAVGERAGATGQDVLSAMVAGYEAAGRIGEALSASSDPSARGAGAISGAVGRGFHASAVVAFGGVVTAAKLLRLNEEQMANAIGMVATTVGGLAIGTNSWAREYHAGNAALAAVNAALAASRGYTVNQDMLEAGGGFLATFGGGPPKATSLTRELNGDYQITRYLAIKLVPGAHALHPAVEAAIDAARRSKASAEDVVKILVGGPQSGLVGGGPPKDTIQAIHSLTYYLASAVAEKDFTWADAAPERIQRPAVVRLMELVERDPSPSPVPFEWNWGAAVTIVTKSGARFVSTVDAPKGSAPRGIEWSDIDAKFHALMPQSGLPLSGIEQALKLIHEFERVDRLSQLTSLIVGRQPRMRRK